MTTEGKGSVLKTAIGLENLKGLGDRLNQIKEFMGKADELQKTLGELAKENSPLSRALANVVEAEGLKSLNEGNINVSEEVRKNMTEELKNKEKTIEELETKNKALEEDRVIRGVTDTVTAELDRRLPKPGERGDDSGGNKLFKALEDVVADYLQKRLLGSGGDGALTSEQIRSVVREEVEAVAGGNKKPEDMVDSIVNAVTMGDKLRDKLGLGGGVNRFLPAQGGDPGLRTDLVKLLLEDERDRLRIAQEYEGTMQRNKHLGTLADTVKENVGIGIDAITAAAKEIKGSTGGKTPTPASAPQRFNCGDCGAEFSLSSEILNNPQFESATCEKCGRKYTKEELLA